MTKLHDRYYYTLKFMLHEGRLIRKIVAFERVFAPGSQFLIAKPLIKMFLNHETVAMHCLINEGLDGTALGLYTITGKESFYVNGFWIQPPNTWETFEEVYEPEEVCRIIEEEREGSIESKTIGSTHKRGDSETAALEALWDKMRTTDRTDH